jgi:biotin transport system ATP-binding protein
LNASPAIELQGVTLVRGATPVFQDLSLSLREPRVGLIGDNGAGKSSLFRLLCGLEEPRAGTVRVAGQGVGSLATGTVGLMFQNPDEQIIFPTVEEELAFSLSARGLPRREAREQARAFLAQRGLSAWGERAIGSLSQGQRQHVCWLALVIGAPQVLLLDEPFASLDLPGQALLRQEIAQAAQTVIVSTHLLDHVRDFGRVLWLERGRVRADGPGAEVCAAYEADVAARLAAHQLSLADAA